METESKYTEADFVRAAVERPWDDTVRMAFADWLEGNAGTVECGACKRPADARNWVPGHTFSAYRYPQWHPCSACGGTIRVDARRAEWAELVKLGLERAAQLRGIPPASPENDKRQDALNARLKELLADAPRAGAGRAADPAAVPVDNGGRHAHADGAAAAVGRQEQGDLTMGRDKHLKRTHNRYDNVGERRDGEPLYAKCGHCTAGCAMCGDTGFIETGWTSERLERTVTDNDRLLLFLDRAVSVLRPDQLEFAARGLLHNHAKELEAAASRSKLTDALTALVGMAGRLPANAGGVPAPLYKEGSPPVDGRRETAAPAADLVTGGPEPCPPTPPTSPPTPSN